MKAAPTVKLTNFRATKLIKNLYSSPTPSTQHHAAATAIPYALSLYRRVSEHERPNVFLINTFLKLCLHHKQHWHALSVWTDVESLLTDSAHGDIDPSTISFPLLLSVYGRCCVDKTERIFELTPRAHRDTLCTALTMKCCLRADRAARALALYDAMPETTLRDDGVHSLALKATIAANAHSKALAMHQTLKAQHCSVALKTDLISCLQHFGHRSAARNIFDSVGESELDSVCVAAMMKGLVDASDFASALALYFEYPSLCGADDFCNVLAIKASIGARDFECAQRIVGRLRAQNLFSDRKAHLNNITLSLYAEIGDVDAAEAHFLSIAPRRRDRAMVNVMMKALVDAQRGDDALALFSQLKIENDQKMDKFAKTALISNVMALRACTAMGHFERGREIHSALRRAGVDGVFYIATALIDLYGRAKDVNSAREVFAAIDSPSAVCVNALMTALLENELFADALTLYETHSHSHISHTNLDATSHILGVKACAHTNEFDKGKAIHAMLEETDVAALRSAKMKTALMTLYGRAGDLATVRRLFSEMPSPDAFGVCALMEALFENEHFAECIAVLDAFPSLHFRGDRIAVHGAQSVHCDGVCARRRGAVRGCAALRRGRGGRECARAHSEYVWKVRRAGAVRRGLCGAHRAAERRGGAQCDDLRVWTQRRGAEGDGDVQCDARR